MHTAQQSMHARPLPAVATLDADVMALISSEERKEYKSQQDTFNTMLHHPTFGGGDSAGICAACSKAIRKM